MNWDFDRVYSSLPDWLVKYVPGGSTYQADEQRNGYIVIALLALAAWWVFYKK